MSPLIQRSPEELASSVPSSVLSSPTWDIQSKKVKEHLNRGYSYHVYRSDRCDRFTTIAWLKFMAAEVSGAPRANLSLCLGHMASLEGLFKHRCWAPLPKFLIQQVWVGAPKSPCLTSPQERWMLLVQEPHLEKTKLKFQCPMLEFHRSHPWGGQHEWIKSEGSLGNGVLRPALELLNFRSTWNVWAASRITLSLHLLNGYAHTGLFHKLVNINQVMDVKKISNCEQWNSIKYHWEAYFSTSGPRGNRNLARGNRLYLVWRTGLGLDPKEKTW